MRILQYIAENVLKKFTRDGIIFDYYRVALKKTAANLKTFSHSNLNDVAHECHNFLMTHHDNFFECESLKIASVNCRQKRVLFQ